MREERPNKGGFQMLVVVLSLSFYLLVDIEEHLYLTGI